MAIDGNAAVRKTKKASMTTQLVQAVGCTKTGIITGILKFKGTHEVMLTAKNNLGQDTQYWTIKGGNTLALTPPMGWNNYNAWGFSIDDDKVRAAADAFDRTGLVDYGWNYINIDDACQVAMDVFSGNTTMRQRN